MYNVDILESQTKKSKSKTTQLNIIFKATPNDSKPEDFEENEYFEIMENIKRIINETTITQFV
jgi:hypothetical protein